MNFLSSIKQYVLFYIISILSIVFLFLWNNINVVDGTRLNIWVQLFSTFLFVIYAATLYLSLKLKDDFYTRKSLTFLYFVLSVPLFLLMTVILFYQTGDLFPYFGSDQIYYDREGRKYIGYSFFGAIEHFVEFNRWWDMGTVMFVRFFYLFWDSPLIIRIVNVFLIWGIAITVYELSKLFMPRKYSFWASLSFVVASFTLYTMVYSNKEPLLMFVVILSLYFITKFVISNKVRYLSFLAIPIFLLVFLRPYLIGLILAAVLLTYVLGKKDKLTKVSILTLSGLAFVAVIPQIVIAYRRFFGNIDAFLLVNQDLIIHSLPVTAILSIGIALIGPLPTFFAFQLQEGVAYYSSGLLFRNITGFIFLCSCFYVILKRKTELLPITIFCLLEVLSLGLLLQSFELRKSMPHFPIVFILIFYFFYIFRNRNFKYKKLIYKINKLYLVVLFIVIIVWNLRF